MSDLDPGFAAAFLGDPAVGQTPLPFWDDGSNNEWDALVLGQTRFPGLATVTGSVSRKVDAKKAPGSDGATLTDQGYEPAKIEITIRVWDREQWDRLISAIGAVHPRRAGGVRQPLDIAHPAANALGVRSVYVTDIKFPEIANGILSLSMSATEWFPSPKPAGGKTDRSEASKTADPSADGDLPKPFAIAEDEKVLPRNERKGILNEAF